MKLRFRNTAIFILMGCFVFSACGGDGGDNDTKPKPKTDADIVATDKNDLEVGYSSGDDKDNVTTNVTLVNKGLYGSDITWNTNDASLIETNGNVSRPAYGEGDGTLTLTATLTKGGVFDTKEFALKVLEIPPQSDAEAVAADLAALTIDYSGSDDTNSVTQNIILPLTGSSGTNIIWQSNNSDVITTDGIVTRPAFGSTNTTVTLTATICKGEDEDTTTYNLVVIPHAFASGHKVTDVVNGISFKMAYVPGGTFPTGTDDAGYDGWNGIAYTSPQTISTPYWVAETEVTYELWHKVYTWATSGSGAPGAGQYTFGFTSGSEPRAGHDGVPGNETTSQEPVTYVNWRHSMAWCNALTEWYNAQNSTNYSPVYYEDAGYVNIIRSVDDTGSVGGYQDAPYIKSDAKGFRLLTSLEWECAARYKGSDSLNGALERPLSSGIYWTPGNYASGATGYAYTTVVNPLDTAGETGPTRTVAWYSINSDSVTKPVMGKTANALGLYDMSGNVWEWCFDWHPSYVGTLRVRRGGSFGSSDADYLQVGGVGVNNPYVLDPFRGFRFSRTQ